MVGLSSRSSSGRGPADQGSDNLDSTRGALAEIVARSFRKRKASVCFRARRATVSIAGLKAYRRSSPTRRLDSRWIVKSDLRDPSGDWQIAYEFEPWVVGLKWVLLRRTALQPASPNRRPYSPDGYLNHGKAARTITDFAKGDEVSLDIENQDNSMYVSISSQLAYSGPGLMQQGVDDHSRACVRVMHPNGLIGHVETSCSLHLDSESERGLLMRLPVNSRLAHAGTPDVQEGQVAHQAAHGAAFRQ